VTYHIRNHRRTAFLLRKAVSSAPRIFRNSILALAALAWTHAVLAVDANQPEAAVVKITSMVAGKRATGTGFVVRLEPEIAYIVTVAHVVEGDKNPSVEFYSRRHSTVQAETLYIETENPRGFALLLVRGDRNLPAGLGVLPLASASTLQTRDEVEVIGYPQGGGGLTVVTAQVSGREGSEWILTGAVDAGNSGGPVLKDGRVVGVVTRATDKFGRANTVMLLRETLNGWGVAPVTAGETAPLEPPSVTAAPAVTAGPKLTGARRLATLEGHQEVVTDAVFSPDGRRLASAGGDGTLMLWDVVTRKVLAKVEGHAEAALSLAFSPDGKTLASASADATVKLWDASRLEPTGEPLQAEECRGGVWGVAFNPDGNSIAAACENDTVFMWNVPDRTLLASLGSECDAPFRVAFSRDGQRLAAGTADACILLWHAQTRAPAGVLSKRVNNTPVLSVAFHPNGKTLASTGGVDGSGVVLWDLATLQRQGEPLRGHTQPALSVVFSPDGETLASAGVDQTLILWDVVARKPIGQPLQGHTEAVTRVAFHPNGRTVVTASADHTLVLWELVFE